MPALVPEATYKFVREDVSIKGGVKDVIGKYLWGEDEFLVYKVEDALNGSVRILGQNDEPVSTQETVSHSVKPNLGRWAVDYSNNAIHYAWRKLGASVYPDFMNDRNIVHYQYVDKNDGLVRKGRLILFGFYQEKEHNGF